MLLPALCTSHKRFNNNYSFLIATITLVCTCTIDSNKARTNALLIITPPTTSNDFRQLASLLASSFDAPSASSTATTTPTPPPSGKKNLNSKGFERILSLDEKFQSNVEWIYWNLVEKAWTEQYTYNQYVSTVQKMRGKKYALFVAKEYTPTKQEANKGDNSTTSGSSLPRVGHGNVVGMIEMGMTIYPTTKNASSTALCGGEKNHQEQQQQQQLEQNNTTTKFSLPSQHHLIPTIGVICVKSSHQRGGIGKSLVDKCKHVAKNVWNETCLLADVEPSNVGALKFLTDSCGFVAMSGNFMAEDDEDGDGRNGRGIMMRYTTVSRRRRMESRPHIILYNRLDRMDSDG